ncbi:MAG: cupin domain-containing protein [Terriglobia bacterium]
MRKMKWQSKAGLVAASVLLLASAAFAVTTILRVRGTLTLVNYSQFAKPDFPDYTGPATVQVAAFKLGPTESTPWHYHEGLAYVVLQSGTVTEDEGCGNVQTFSAGSGFIETPGTVHRVINSSATDDAIIYWSTAYPSSVTASVPSAPPVCH